ncbi:MAG: hypothetical protein ACK59M_06390, partial [Pseudomonadota bacterium]
GDKPSNPFAKQPESLDVCTYRRLVRIPDDADARADVLRSFIHRCLTLELSGHINREAIDWSA